MRKDLVEFMINQARSPENNDICIEDFIESINRNKENILSPCVISDLSSTDFVYASKNIKNLIGYSHQDVMKDKIIMSYETLHPDDTNRMFTIFEDIFSVYFSIPIEQRLNYKFCNDFRFKRHDGRFIWLLHEFMFLKYDNQGKPLISLSRVKDITSIKGEDTLNLYIGRCDDQCNYSIQFSKRYPLLKNESKLTRREIEILKMISDGYLSKQIADKLHISFHTVNTHRQHMLEKTNTTTSSELVSYAREHGMI